MKKNILSIGLVMSLATVSLFGLTGCSTDSDKHTHQYTAATTYIVENNKAYTQTTCSCGETSKTEMQAGTYIIATPENAQMVLDGFANTAATEKTWNNRTAEDLSPISNKTIVFSDGNYGNLFLRAGANPSVYETNTSTTALTRSAETELTATTYTYVRTISNTKFVGTSNAVFTGTFGLLDGYIDYTKDPDSNYYYYDTVRNIEYVEKDASGNVVPFKSNYESVSVANIKFENLTFNGRYSRIYFKAEKRIKNATANGITVNNCKFLENNNRIIDASNKSQDQSGTIFKDNVAAIMLESFDANFFSNVTVTNCEITKYYLGVKAQDIENITVSNNKLTNVEHNSIQILGSIGDKNWETTPTYASGVINVEKNVIHNTRNQVFKFYYTKNANITLKDNVATDCGWIYTPTIVYIKEVTNKGTTTFSDINNRFNGTLIPNETRNLITPTMVDFICSKVECDNCKNKTENKGCANCENGYLKGHVFENYRYEDSEFKY